MQRIPYFASVAAISCFLLGCPQTTSLPGGEEFLVPFVADNNIEYIDAIVPHHQMAVQMADREIAAGEDETIVQMAQQMREAQLGETAMLKAVRERLTGNDSTPDWPADSHMDADMAGLENATGAVLDQLFLGHMIEHHSSGIGIAHRALSNLSELDLIANAENVVLVQSMEIGEMRALLE